VAELFYCWLKLLTILDLLIEKFEIDGLDFALLNPNHFAVIETSHWGLFSDF
jgi:hypothetical protein